MKLFRWALLFHLALTEKLNQWMQKTHSGLEKTLKLGRPHSELLQGADGALIVVLPTDKAWSANKDLYKQLQGDPSKVEDLMLMIAVLLETKKPPKNIDAILKLQSKVGGVLMTAGFADLGVKVKKQNGEVKVVWQKMKDDGSFKTEGKPIKINPSPIVLDDATVFKAESIALPSSFGI
eukprot:Protomagalhaensia_sp_Gyna_25__491@NODE_1232_length_2040_cov_8_459270_g983_i0_p2_GENE_NODE_1232_length_2040_cov_8_459270_g983_i0NODE_1232_length_2040_cov_8_459270_g983_i0_p2_ORF_typecomplete_len179_score23_54Fasciclin/PF02469_22/0_054_NODE_1232_length_2040_cov_8_459270_g983_i09351471